MAKVSARGAYKVASWKFEDYRPGPSHGGNYIKGKAYLLRSDGVLLSKLLWSDGTKESWNVMHRGPHAWGEYEADSEEAILWVEHALESWHEHDGGRFERTYAKPAGLA